ncbi:MAG TPA: copper homeostasis protein CutC [Caulobacteraceae bacterium]|jgi:copper homeostasis protein|nr:copper homeostasis protein CutC [Caulobacteraceae bacterium]
MVEPLRLEVCVDTPEGLETALAAGADRIELCAALALHGLTPAPGLMARAAGGNAWPMIRPRAGDFVFSPAEDDAMRRDIDAARAAGLPGVVLGASRPNGELDADLLARLIAHAAGLGHSLHRAFDLAPDLGVALETAIALGFERVLTSGGAHTAPEGAAHLADLVAVASGRIVVMAGSGVTANNVGDLVRATGVTEVHASCSGPAVSRAEVDTLGFEDPGRRETSADAVRAMAAALRAA